MTGREETDKKYTNLIERKLVGQPEAIMGFYYSLSSASVRTANTYITIILKFLNSVNKPMKDIRRIDIDKYFKDIDNTSKANRKLIYATLGKFFQYCTDSGYIDSNVFKGVQRIKGYDKRNKDVLTKEECAIFLNNAKSSNSRCAVRDYCILYLFVSTGIRASALREMNLDDVNFEEGSIFIRTKRDKSATLQISKDAMDVIAEYLDWREKYVKDTNALFISMQGTRMCPRAVSNVVNNNACNINGKHITPHRLRATFATMIYDCTHDIKLIQSLLMHERLSTTNLYIEDRQNKSLEASELISDLLGNI